MHPFLVSLEDALRLLQADGRRGSVGHGFATLLRRLAGRGVEDNGGRSLRRSAHVPETHGMVVAGGNEPAAVRGRQEAGDHVGVAVEAPDRGRGGGAGLLGEVPDVDVPDVVAGGDAARRAEDRRGGDPVVVPRQRPGESSLVELRGVGHGSLPDPRVATRGLTVAQRIARTGAAPSGVAQMGRLPAKCFARGLMPSAV